MVKRFLLFGLSFCIIYQPIEQFAMDASNLNIEGGLY